MGRDRGIRDRRIGGIEGGSETDFLKWWEEEVGMGVRFGKEGDKGGWEGRREGVGIGKRVGVGG